MREITKLLNEFDSTVQVLRGAQFDEDTINGDACQRVVSVASKLWHDRTSETLPETIGRFQIVERLGRGSSAVVYRGYDPELERDVAIKVSRQHPDALRREACKLAQMRNAGIVAVYELLNTEKFGTVLVMELAQGRTLRSRLREGLDCVQAVELTTGICRALESIHRRGGVHRDLKPENILVDDEGGVQLVDFGLIFDEREWSSHVGEVAGTLPYMAPETLAGSAHEVDGRADVWSVGVILFEMLTETRPFFGDRDQLLAAIEDRQAKPPRQVDPRIPVAVERACLKCLEKSAKNRFTTVSDLAEDLEAWLVKIRSTGRWKIAALAGAFLVLVAVAAAGWLGRSPDAPQNQSTASRPEKPTWSIGLLSDGPRDLSAVTHKAPPDFRWATSKDSIVLYGKDFGAVKLGETKGIPFRFSCLMDGDYEHRAGLFWGYRIPPGGAQQTARIYYVALVWEEKHALIVELRHRDLPSYGSKRPKHRYEDQRIEFTKKQFAGFDNGIPFRLDVSKGKVVVTVGNKADKKQVTFILPKEATHGVVGVCRETGLMEFKAVKLEQLDR